MFIVAIQTGIGILTLPTDVGEHAGHDGWITVIIGGVLCLLASIIIIALCKRFNGQSVLDINRMIFGKYVSYLLNIFLLLYLLFAVLSNLCFFVSTVGVWFFRETPLWILSLYTMIPSMVLAYKGLKGVCRFNFLLFVTVPVLLSMFVLTLKDFRMTNLMPIGIHGAENIMKSLVNVPYAFMGFETLLFIFPFIMEKQHINKHTIIGAAVLTLIYTYFVMTSIAVFGEDLLSKRIIAFVGIARMIEVPVIERVDLYYLAIWLPALLLAVNAYLFLAYNTTKKVFKVKSKRIPFTIIIIIVIVLTSIFGEDSYTVYQMTRYAGYALFFVGVPYPVLLLSIALISRKGAKNKA